MILYEEYVDMPEFENEDITSWKKITVHFHSEEDYLEFARLVKQNLTHKTKLDSFP